MITQVCNYNLSQEAGQHTWTAMNDEQREGNLVSWMSE